MSVSLLDKLRQAWEGTKEDASRAATRAATDQALAAAKKAVEVAGEELLGDAEKLLAEAEQARAGRPALRPGGDRAQEIEAYIKDIASEAEQARQARTEREAAAREELARLKAERKERGE